MYLLQQPYPQFTGLDGQPLNNGYIYIGLVGSNPEAAPTAVYWDSSLTIPASQPIRTINGYPSRNGSPAKMYCATDAQMTVRDVNLNLIYSDTARIENQNVAGLFSQDAEPAAGVMSSGDTWIDTDYDTNKYGVYRFDGTDNILTGVIDTSVNQFYPSNALEYTTVTPALDADVTLSQLQYETGRIVLADGAWTAGHNVIFPDDKRIYYVDNLAGSYTAECKTAAGGVAQVPANSTAVLYCDGTDMVFASPSELSGDGALCRHKNLVIKNNVTNPNYQVDIDADELLLSGHKVAGVNLTVDITASGANGLDAGAEANSTWYHLWVIYNGTTAAGLLSTSATAPTIPGGYTYKGYVGAIFNNSSGNFHVMGQVDKFVAFDVFVALATGSSTSYASVSLTEIPTTAKKVHGVVTGNDAAGTAFNVYVASKSTREGEQIIGLTVGGASSVNMRVPFSLPLLEAQTIYYKVVSGDTSDISVHGYEY
jgi:hypothetical protein